MTERDSERIEERQRHNAEMLDYLTGDGDWQLGMSMEEAARHLFVICPQASDALEQSQPVTCGHHNCELYAKGIEAFEERRWNSAGGVHPELKPWREVAGLFVPVKGDESNDE